MEWGYLCVGTALITMGAAGSVAAGFGEPLEPVTLAVGTAALAVGIVLVGLAGQVSDAQPA
ncbi:MAG: hypothetical protein ACOCYZ_05895 [Halococcoides sp.]